MEKIKHLILENKAWSKSKLDVNPEYFKTMSKDQKPEYLWIGCSDSRVPESEITNSTPGQIFVHRNIANLVVHTDMNFLSVVSYAVNTLKVPHVIICGHYNCGGVRAALSQTSLGLIDNWVRNIKDTYFTHRFEIDSHSNEIDKVNRLVELNVLEQVRNLSHTSIIQNAWKQNNSPHIHGWIYDLNTGLIKELITISPNSVIDHAYKYDF
ncbi:MAG: carbonic anhydrase [Bacteriovoracaceae bacterium]